MAAVFAARLPQSFDGRFRSFRVTVDGGAARGARGSQAQLIYFNALTHRYFDTSILNGKRGPKRGKTVRDGKDVVIRPRIDPTVVWSVGVAGGNRFDVRSFTVEVERQVLS